MEQRRSHSQRPRQQRNQSVDLVSRAQHRHTGVWKRNGGFCCAKSVESCVHHGIRFQERMLSAAEWNGTLRQYLPSTFGVPESCRGSFPAHVAATPAWEAAVV